MYRGSAAAPRRMGVATPDLHVAAEDSSGTTEFFGGERVLGCTPRIGLM